MTTSHIQYDLFGGLPPSARRSSTSRAAAESILPKINSLQKRIWKLVSQAKHGLTRDEIEILTGLPHTTSSARVRELFLKGLLETRIDKNTGVSIRRSTRSGRQAEVCFAVSPDKVK
jgi:hypothetical protein